MFYGQCNACGERWGLGTVSTCKCPDLVTWDASAPIVTTPHPAFKKPWIGLTEEELYEIYDAVDDGHSPCGVCGACGKCKREVVVAKAVEAKLKEKNT